MCMLKTRDGPRSITWAPLHNAPYSKTEIPMIQILSVSIQNAVTLSISTQNDVNFEYCLHFQSFFSKMTLNWQKREK